ncbi:HDIG domain-containing protein [Carboxydocella thermautotrophica]|nr:HDIG domain-containing protein [Carboxydocella thermautotrophica]
MLRRFKQFFGAIFSKMTDKDREYVNSYLNLMEQTLFYHLDPITQKHCVRVARTCEKLFDRLDSEQQSRLNREALIKGALLHDIGKVSFQISLLERVIMVMVNALFPGLVKKYAYLDYRSPLSWWHRMCHSYLYHGEIGWNVARTINTIDSITLQLIRHHHSQEHKIPAEIEILRLADNLN